MSAEGEAPKTERLHVPSIERVTASWEKNTLISLLSRLQGTLDKLAGELVRVSGNLDHLHDDVVAIREVAHVPRPECYPDAEKKRGARRARRAPPPPPPEAAPGLG
jgi:hypothetical protein